MIAPSCLSPSLHESYHSLNVAPSKFLPSSAPAPARARPFERESRDGEGERGIEGGREGRVRFSFMFWPAVTD